MCGVGAGVGWCSWAGLAHCTLPLSSRSTEYSLPRFFFLTLPNTSRIWALSSRRPARCTAWPAGKVMHVSNVAMYSERGRFGRQMCAC